MNFLPGSAAEIAACPNRRTDLYNRRMSEPLPIDAILPQVSEALARSNRLVLAAPPGAGKTTRLPLAIKEDDWLGGQRILLLEPRRIAARRAAERLAASLGEPVGQTIGLRTRLDTRTSRQARIEVLTEGVFTNMLVADPELSGIGAVLFDEFHERSLEADLGLALARESQSALRDDLRLMVMSATIETGVLGRALDAPVLVSEGRSYPVRTVYLGRGGEDAEDAAVRGSLKALAETPGSVLVFLPGAREIRRVGQSLADRVPGNVDIAPLFGALSPAEQDAAIAPAPDGRRKLVLATDIAESSLTIEGLETVVDAGLARVPVFDPHQRRQSLRTVRASLASVDQRRGRAGRTGPGTCYRLWDEAENRGLAASIEPEILGADLTDMVLTLARWGERNPAALPWVTPPPPGRIAAAIARCTSLGLIDGEGMLTARGAVAARLPLATDLAALIASATTPQTRALASRMAALLSERGLGGPSTDIESRLAGFERDRSPRAKGLMRQAANWGGDARPAPSSEAGKVLAAAFTDRIARRRDGSATQYISASGSGARLKEADPLARHDWLVIAEEIGTRGSDALITCAAALSEAHALAHLDVSESLEATYLPEDNRVKARKVRKAGAIILSQQPVAVADNTAVCAAVLSAIREGGLQSLPDHEAVRVWRARVQLARQVFGEAHDWPDVSDTRLVDDAGVWLGPALLADGLAALKADRLETALNALLDWQTAERLRTAFPPRWPTPAGRSVDIDYLDEKAPLAACKVQEVFGLRTHPALADGRLPLTLSLTSPAGRPVAITRDLPGFWQGGYVDMRKDMRAQYPKHDWPEDPAAAEAKSRSVKHPKKRS